MLYLEKNLHLLLSCFLLLLSTVVQAQWQWQNPLPQGNTLSSVTFVNQQIAWAGASGGTLIKTTNAGSSWQVVTLPKRIFADALYFIDENFGWVGGQMYDGSGALMATTNAGKTWAVQLADTFADFRTISFVNRRQGWATGQHSRIYHTSNGGGNWNLQADFWGLQFIYSLSFTDSLNGWGAANELLHTTNGGLIWQQDSTILWARDIVFVDSLRGWVCGQGKIALTNNGGRSWLVRFDSTLRWTNLTVSDFNHVWAISNNGSIVITSNGGAQWTIQNNVAGATDIAFRDTMNGLVVGGNGLILKSSDRGITWQNNVQTVTSSDLYGVHFLDTQRGWISGRGGTILKTTNGGTEWTRLQTISSSPLSDVYFIDQLRGWTVGGDTIFHTTDSGVTWSRENYPVSGRWSDIEFKYYPTGWIAGGDALLGGRLLKTTDGGSSWNVVVSLSLPPGAPEVQFTSSSVGWIMVGNSCCGSQQFVFKTTDAGMSWQTVLTGNSDSAFLSLSFVSDSVGWVSTLGYVLFKTTNGGNSWQMFPTPYFFSSLCFITASEGWAGGSNGEVYHTTDGGLTWTPQFNPFGNEVYALKFIDSQHGWAIGFTGKITATTNGGATDVQERRDEAPNNKAQAFTLYQNYPNPFNPSTVIKFNVFTTVNEMQLTIYDILGRVIRTIEIHEPHLGLNEVSWDGKNNFGKEVASGIYIYGVVSKKSMQFKKMLLVR